MKKLHIYIIKFLILIIFLYLLRQFFEWQSPFNENGFNDAQHCIIDNTDYKTISLSSMGHNFELNYVRSASPKCISPYFPAISISTHTNHNKWILIDSQQQSFLIPNTEEVLILGTNIEQTENFSLQEKLFKNFHDQEHLLFYSSQKDFFSNYSGIIYNIFTKHKVHRTLHAWAIQIDSEAKIIQCIGGIAWGFWIPWYSLFPKMIEPYALTEQDWKTDWLKLNEKIKLQAYQKIPKLLKS